MTCNAKHPDIPTYDMTKNPPEIKPESEWVSIDVYCEQEDSRPNTEAFDYVYEGGLEISRTPIPDRHVHWATRKDEAGNVVETMRWESEG